MKEVFSELFQFRGSHYDFGYYQGEKLLNSFILPNREKQWASRKKRHFYVEKDKALDVIRHFLPSLIDELFGLADAFPNYAQGAFNIPAEFILAIFYVFTLLVMIGLSAFNSRRRGS